MTKLEKAQGADLLPDLHAGDAPMTGLRPLLDRLNDVPVKVSAILGKTRMDLATLMTLGAGAVIELDRRVGEPIDLYVNDRLIARGELVLIDGVLGVTMTEIVRPEQA